MVAAAEGGLKYWKQAGTWLEDERAEAGDLAPIEVDDQAGALGGASVGLERATSVLEPSIGTYQDEALREAFAADEDCEHVIQPF